MTRKGNGTDFLKVFVWVIVIPLVIFCGYYGGWKILQAIVEAIGGMLHG